MSLAPEFQGISAEHPWPGLMPFTEEAQAFFHGRDAETAELLRLIKREPLTVLFGQSGLGKSSLLNAGLFPRLRREEFLPIYIRLDISATAPELAAQTREIIARSLGQHAVDTRAPRDDETLWEYFHATDVDFWSARNQLLTPVLIFDQFEELFTLGRHSDEMRSRCRTFIEELGDLIENRTPELVVRKLEENADLATRLDFAKRNCKILLSFREDFLPDFEGLRRSIRSIMQNRMRLTRMRGVAALEAITLSGGDLVASGIAERIVEFVSGSRAGGAETEVEYAHLEIEPALLSLVCRELNNKRIAARRAQITADLLESGAQQEIIADFYERSLADLDPGMRVFVEDQLLTESGYRDSYALEDALTLPGVTREAIDTLVARRLLRLDERFGVLRIELTHDVLTRVVRDSRDRRQQRLAIERRREQDAARRRRMRTLIAWSATGVTLAVAVAVTFAILFNRTLEEKQRLIETQSLALLDAANRQLELNVAGEPQAVLAQSLKLNPGNQAAVARAVAYLTQRNFPMLLAQVDVSEGPYLSIDWMDPSRVALRAGKAVAVFAGQRGSSTGEIGFSSTSGEMPSRERAALAQRDLRRISRTAAAAQDAQEAAAPMARNLDGKVVAWIEGRSRLRVAWEGGRQSHAIEVAEGVRPPLLLSADGQRLLVVSEKRSVLLFGLSPQAGLGLLRTMPAEDGLVRYGPARSRLAALSGSNVTLYDLDADRHLELPHPLLVNSLEISPDGTRIVTACQDKFARIWETAGGTLVAAPLRHDGSVLSASFGDDGQRVITGSLDGTARIWSATSGEPLTEPLVAGHPVTRSRLSPDSSKAVTYGGLSETTSRLMIWGIAAGAAPAIKAPARITVMDSFPGGSLIAVSTVEGDISVWRIGDPTANEQLAAQVWSARSPQPVTQLLFSPDGKVLAVATTGNYAYLWDVVSGKRLDPPLRHRGAVQSMRFSSNGELLATGAADAGARVWRVSTRRLRGSVLIHEREALQHLAFSPDATLLLTGTSAAKGGVLRIWNLNEDAMEERIPTGRLAFAEFSNGREITAAVDSSVVRWTIEARIPGNTSATGAPVRNLSRYFLKQRGKVDVGGRIWSAGLNPGGSRLVAGRLDGTSRLIDLATMQPIGEAMKSNGVVVGADFTADGRWVVTRSADRTARVWDGRSGHAVTDAMRHDTDLELTPHYRVGLAGRGRYLLTSGGEGMVTVQPIGLDFPPPAPAWLPDLLETAGGGALTISTPYERSYGPSENAAGTMVWFQDRSGALREIRAKIGHDRGSWWGSWASGTLAHLSAATAPGAAEKNK